MQRQSKLHNEAQFTVGIDVSKASLDVCILPCGIQIKVANDNRGHKELIRELVEYRIGLIVLEPTGKYHQKLHQALEQARFGVAVINPYRSRKFADTVGQLAKSDVIDARMLALFGKHINPTTTPAPTDLMLEINALVLARASLVEDQTALKNRIGATNLKRLVTLFTKRLRNISKDIAQLDKDILKLIKSDEKMARWNDILLSIPGIGQISAIALIAKWFLSQKCRNLVVLTTNRSQRLSGWRR